MKYSLILIFAYDTMRGVAIHSQLVGVYGSESAAVEAGEKAKANKSSNGMNVSFTVFPEPDYSERSKQLNY